MSSSLRVHLRAVECSQSLPLCKAKRGRRLLLLTFDWRQVTCKRCLAIMRVSYSRLRRERYLLNYAQEVPLRG